MVRVGVWLCMLPILLCIYTLPELLLRLNPAWRRSPHCNPVAVDRVVQLVTWLCQRRLFRMRLFPRTCLR